MSTSAPIEENDGWFKSEDKGFQFYIQFEDPQGFVGGLNITGWTIKWVLSAAQGGVAELTKTATIIDGPNGICRVTVNAADTSAMAAGVHYYSLWRTNSGSRAQLAQGTALLQTSLTAVPA